MSPEHAVELLANRSDRVIDRILDRIRRGSGRDSKVLRRVEANEERIAVPIAK